MTDENWLIPVSRSATIRNTVAYAINQGIERGSDSPISLHFVYPLSRRLAPDETAPDARELLELVVVWTDEDLSDTDVDMEIETAVIGARQYLFHPADFADVLTSYARDHHITTAFLDPEFNPGGIGPLYPSLESELVRQGLRVIEAPVERPVRRSRLVRRAGIEQFGLLFGLSVSFYLVLGGTFSQFDLITGTISGFFVAVLLWQVSLTGPVKPVVFGVRMVRLIIYVPFLLWEIVKANVEMAYVVLHPSLPIDPEMVEFDAVVWAEIPVTTLANSITLTPGTLTVDITKRHFTVHTLTEGARQSLLSGSLERGVRFVFYGRSAARIPSPKERMEQGEE